MKIELAGVQVPPVASKPEYATERWFWRIPWGTLLKFVGLVALTTASAALVVLVVSSIA